MKRFIRFSFVISCLFMLSYEASYGVTGDKGGCKPPRFGIKVAYAPCIDRLCFFSGPAYGIGYPIGIFWIPYSTLEKSRGKMAFEVGLFFCYKDLRATRNDIVHNTTAIQIVGKDLCYARLKLKVKSVVLPIVIKYWDC